MKGWAVSLHVTYESVDITADLRSYMLSWTYTDNLSGQADDLQLTLEDSQALWIGPWAPQEGAVLVAEIRRGNWIEGARNDVLPLGQFELDELEGEDRPSTVTIKATSVPESSSLRGEQKDRAWEKVTLSVIANDIAKGAGLEILFDTEDNPEYDRMEQTGETDLSFLMRLCNDSGLCLKVTGDRMVIFDEEKYERLDPVDTINRYTSGVKNLRWRRTLQGLYSSCRVDYQGPNSKSKLSATFTPPNPPKTKRVLRINEQVDSHKAALRLACKKLRNENKNAVSVSFTLPGDTRYVAGVTLMLDGFGVLNGKYIVTQATHSQQSGYETSLELRRCLEGY